MVHSVDLKVRCQQLAKFTALRAFPGADQKQERSELMNNTCMRQFLELDFAGFLSTIMQYSEAVFASESDANVQGFYVLAFSFLDQIKEPTQVSATVKLLKDSITGGSGKAALRLNILADLYNVLADGSQDKFEAFLAVINFAASTQQVDVLLPFLGNADAYAAKHSLTPAQLRELLQTIAAALDGAGHVDVAQQYRIQFLGTFQGEPADVLAQAKDAAVTAALGYFKAPVVSQKSNLPTLDAVTALKSDSETSRVYELLHVFAAGRVEDYAAFVGAGDNKAWMTSLGVDPVESEATVRLLTLSSLASASHTLAYADVAEALQVPVTDVESWVVRGVGRGLLDAKCSQETQTITISRSTTREFGPAQWQALQTKLNTWRSNIDGVLQRLRSARVESTM